MFETLISYGFTYFFGYFESKRQYAWRRSLKKSRLYVPTSLHISEHLTQIELKTITAVRLEASCYPILDKEVDIKITSCCANAPRINVSVNFSVRAVSVLKRLHAFATPTGLFLGERIRYERSYERDSSVRYIL